MKIILIESIPLLREAISELIESQGHVVQYLSDLQKATEEIPEIQPDLIWVDATLPDVQSGLLIKTIHKKFPKLKILVFGLGQTIPEIRKYFKLGTCAYLPKTVVREEITAALAILKTGGIYVPASLNKAFANWLTDPMHKKKPGCNLTNREQEILQLIVEEFTTHEIAIKLFICQCTVETHRNNLIQKLGVKNTAGLVRVAFEAGLYQHT